MSKKLLQLYKSLKTKYLFLSLVTEKVVRLICGAQRSDHTSSLFFDLRILKLPDMAKLKTAEIMYKAFI